MTITQVTPKMAIDWQSFSIGQGKSVTFVQPTAGAVALNRVTGTDVSVIQGSLSANGQIFLVNPNGVLFTPTAQVNVGGIVASTLSLKADDFMAGNYQFNGSSSNALINQGNITASAGGTIALIAAKITNTGSITADQGNVLLGAGSDVELDMGGPVKLRVNQGALNALIEQGGAIRANGGLVYLTAKAAGDLVSTVINHTGITEAKTLATGEKGQIVLLGGMEKDRIVVGGTLDASAPNGGDGGFIETSSVKVQIQQGVHVSTLAAAGESGTWLIDPTNFVISSGTAAQSDSGIGADTLSTALGNGNVTIQTVAAGPDQGDITVMAAVSKTSGTATTLTLAADRNIDIYASYDADWNTVPTIAGSSGHPLNVVLAARARGGANGAVGVYGDIRTFGGNLTIGGGDVTASDYAIANSQAGVLINGMLDASGNGSGSSDSNLPTATTGGNISIRGKGTSADLGPYNWGVKVQYGAVVTGGAGNIDIVGYGGNGSGAWAVGSVGVLLESYAYVKSNTGNITIKGYAGTGHDAYGIASTETSKLIGTNGWLKFEGDSLLLRNGTLTVYAGQNSDIKAPIVGCVSFYCDADVAFVKQGSGILNLWGNASAWTPPANTYQSIQGTGTFTDASNSVNVVGITADQALYAFGTRPTTVNAVTQSTSAASETTLTYTLADVGFSSALSYKGSGYLLGDYWSATAIFGNAGSGLVLGTDYNFLYNGSTVTSFTNAGTYSGITVSLSKANYALAATGNTSGSFKITPKALTITAPSIAAKSYDGSAAAGTLTLGTLSGFAGSETVTVSGTAAALASKDAGSYTTTVSYTLADGSNGGLASNYSLASSSGVSAAITAKQVTISGLAASNKVYDGTVSASVSNWGSVSTGVGSETLTLNHGAASFDTANAGTGKTVTATGYSLANGSGGLASNYQLTSTSATTTANVEKAPLVVTADNKTKELRESDPPLTWRITSGSLLNGDSLSGALTRSRGENVGSYIIDASALANANYLITGINGVLTINNTIGTTSAIANIQSQATASVAPVLGKSVSAVANVNTLNLAQQSASSPNFSASGGLILVNRDEAASNRPSADAGGNTSPTLTAGLDASGFMRVFVVKGGINADLGQ